MPEQPGDDALAEVRRLLRSARVTESPPDAVVARLDETLATLVADRGAAEAPTTAGDDLAARRARRRRLLAGAGLVAAATVVAAGFLGQVVGSGAQDDQSTADRSEQTMAEQGAAEDAPSIAADMHDMQRADPPGAYPLQGEAAPDSLDRDQRRALRYALVSLSAEIDRGGRSAPRLGYRDAGPSVCPTALTAGGTVQLAVRVAGDLQTLLLRPMDEDGSRRVEVVDCTVDPPVVTNFLTVPPSSGRE